MDEKRENKIMKDININEVPSLEQIKTKMDFSKNPFREIKEVLYTKSKLKLACSMTSLITLILCVIMCAVWIRIDEANTYDNILSRDEVRYIVDNNECFNNKPICNYQIFGETYLYIFKASDRNCINKQYYFKMYGESNVDFKIYINNEVIEVSKDNAFGLFYISNKQEIITFEIEYNGEKKAYSFSN